MIHCHMNCVQNPRNPYEICRYNSTQSSPSSTVNCWSRDGKQYKMYKIAPVPFRHVLLKRHAPCTEICCLKREKAKTTCVCLMFFFWICIRFTFVPLGSFRNISQIACGPVAHAYPLQSVPGLKIDTEPAQRSESASDHLGPKSGFPGPAIICCQGTQLKLPALQRQSARRSNSCL